MKRDSKTPNKIALLATGDEITNGDILNTNSQSIAQQLFSAGIQVGTHMTVSDHTVEIEEALNYLLKNHRAIIITGGLGPTSDDLTRYALSKALQKKLIFDENTWEAICDRLKQVGLAGPPPEGNRQQALFPEDSIIIPNPNGTAAGCMAKHNNQFIFMLPGPPMECLPMVHSFVIPTLQREGLQELSYYNHWLLFGVSEGHIAEVLDKLAEPFDCVTGYRLFYPYIEFKLQSNNKKDFEILSALVEATIAPYLITDGKQPISSLLQKKLMHINSVLTISDQATGGLLESILKTPENYTHLSFSTQQPTVEIKGLNDFWQGKTGNLTDLEIVFSNGYSFRKQIPFRGIRVKQYAIEIICQEINTFLSMLENK